MHTEDEAKKCLCPFSFSVPEIRDANDCGVRQGGPWNCIASECMAWRWVVGPPTKFDEAPHNETDNSERWHGYCGRAGKP